MISITTELPGNERVELIMRVMAAYNQQGAAGDRNAQSFDLGTLPKPTLKRYWNIATRIDAAISKLTMGAKK